MPPKPITFLQIITVGAGGALERITNVEKALNLLVNALNGRTTTNMNIQGSVGIGTAPTSSAILHLDSTTKGLLVPRMTAVQMNAISNPVNGLIVYDTTNNKFKGYEAGAWTALI